MKFAKYSKFSRQNHYHPFVFTTGSAALHPWLQTFDTSGVKKCNRNVYGNAVIAALFTKIFV